ncbi:hypothetical protein C349_02603 [Cryptococcus neoformans var. grubii Br795]|nr:hypothetical protein C349_02603 [Cryptococcus neoformans var. grubii Br795]
MVRTIVVEEPLLKTGCVLGEGCIWDAQRQRLYFVDIDGKKIYTYEPSSGTHGYQSFDKKPTALALLQDGSGLLVSLEDGPAYVPFTSLPFPPTNSSSTYKRLPVDIAPPDGFFRFNEACVDPTGNRWLIGTMMIEDNYPNMIAGTLYALQADGNGGLVAPQILDGITVSNGMGWSHDLKTMYFTDSIRKEIWEFDFNAANGEMSNKRIFSGVDQPELGYPDGMCQDAQYGFWSARWGASKVLHFTPDGELDLIIQFPKALNMTSCIFGGANMDELYVTSASAATSGDSVEKFPDSGHLYVVKGLGFEGRERTRFSGKLPVNLADIPNQ